MFSRKCKITFIAHGSTINTEENRLSDKENHPPLNDLGQEEIENICEWLKRRGLKSDKIYSSADLRTAQSANLISKVFKKDFEIIENLSARKFGTWSGLTYDQIEDKYPQVIEQLHQNPCSYCPQGGETAIEFSKRISEKINKIVEENEGNRIIIVTHPDVIRSAICSALNIPLENMAKIYIKPSSATQISYFKDWASLLYCGFIPS